ncbi:MAG: hypothetical protein WC052_05530, partial [Patescibacteria group bacterium]
STILWSVGLGFAPLATRAAQAGDLIKMAGNSAVYYLGSDGKRYVFPNDKSYFTWYSDFSGVVTVSQSELQSYQIGGNVTYRAGTRLVKITTDPKVYAVEPGGLLRWVTSESIAITLFGSNWASTVDDVSDAFFVNYTVGSSISSNTYPTGSLIKLASSSDVYYVDGSSKRMVTAAGFSANKLNSMYVRTADASVFNALGSGSQITGTESAIWNVSGGASGPVVGGSGLSVSLASDTPASTVQADGTAYNPVLKLNLTAAADGAVNLTGLTVTRQGLSADSDVDGVGFFDANGMRHGNFVSFADTKAAISFSNDPVVVPAGQTVAVWVKTNLGSSISSATYAVSVVSSSDVKTTAAVSGSFPIVGNGFSVIDGSSSVGGLTIGDQILASSAVSVDIGVTNYLLAKLRMTAGANEPVRIARVRLFNNGTTDDNDIQNYTLVAPDGTVLATAAEASNRYITFTLTTPYQIAEGNSRDLEVHVDVKDGSSRTAQLNIQNNYDVEVYGLETGSGLLPTAVANDTSFPIGDTSGRNTLTVRAGTLTVNKAATSPSGEIGKSTPNTVLAIWELEAKGEPIELQRVDLDLFTNSSSGVAATDLTGTIKLQTTDGTTLMSFAPTATDGGELFASAVGTDSQTLSNYLTIQSGQKVKIQLVVDTDSDISTGESLRAGIGDLYYKQTTSNTYSTASDDVLVTGNPLTVTTNSLTVTSNGAYASQNITAGQAETRLGSFLLKANNAEGINITSMALQFNGADAVGVTDISNVKLKRADTGVQIGSTLATVADVAGASNTFSVAGQLNIAANASVLVDVYGSIASGASDGDGTGDTLAITIPATTGISGVGAQSGATIPANSAATLQTITFVQSGTLTVAVDQSGAASSQFYTTGLSGVEMARVKLTTTNEGAKLQKLELRSTNGTGNIDSVKLMGTGLTSDPVTNLSSGLATFTFSSGSEITVPSNSSKVLTVVINTTPLQSLIGGNLGVLGFNTADAIGADSGVAIQERISGGTVCTAGTACGTLAAGDLVYFTVAGDGAAATDDTPGFKLITAVTSSSLIAADSLTLEGTAANSWATSDLITELPMVESVAGDGNAGVTYAIGDIVYVYDADDNEAGFKIVTTGVASGDALTGLAFSPAGSVAIDAAGDRVVKLTNANAIVGNTMRYEEVEPVITLSASSPSGTTSPNSEQTVGVFNVKAEGGRDMTFNGVTVEKNGSNSPERYVTKLSLWNGSTKLAEVANSTVSGTTAVGITNADTILNLCSGTSDTAGEIGGITQAEADTLEAGDRVVIVDGTNTNTVTISAVTGTTIAACSSGAPATGYAITFDGTVTIAASATVDFRNNRVHFDASQANTNDTALVEQTVTAGQTMTLTVKADTSSVKTGAGTSTITFGVNIPGSNGPLQVTSTQIEGFSWDYSPLNSNGAASYKTEGDSYPVIGNTLSY